MKKTFFRTVLMMFIGTCLFMSCEQPEEKCPHFYSSEWSYDDTCHWHKATCACEDAGVKDKGEHRITEWTDTGYGKSKGACSICGKEQVLDTEAKAEATKNGIKFTIPIPSNSIRNIVVSKSLNIEKTSWGSCVEIRKKDEGFTVPAITFVYPYVDTGKNYDFEVRYYNDDMSLFVGSTNSVPSFSVQATNGKGEMYITNKPAGEYDIEKKVFTFTTFPVFSSEKILPLLLMYENFATSLGVENNEVDCSSSFLFKNPATYIKKIAVGMYENVTWPYEGNGSFGYYEFENVIDVAEVGHTYYQPCSNKISYSDDNTKAEVTFNPASEEFVDSLYLNEAEGAASFFVNEDNQLVWYCLRKYRSDWDLGDKNEGKWFLYGKYFYEADGYWTSWRNRFSFSNISGWGMDYGDKTIKFCFDENNNPYTLLTKSSKTSFEFYVDERLSKKR